ncbi:helix-turn-helix domain-containing protein [Enterococcus hirae]|nr:helix-turn-helix domain-containing protein [Enterococcus faecium]EGP5600122.1 helix-turn-helix domain-containing protein [Enterococcus faecium]EMF0589129.1 helix-turn-helix domain-containing protein [Enterococcus faecium]MBL3707527.1 helix-turn-helix domain-containing protein [Enterococcus faecium]MCH1977702.1 helix-turn-helix domain-containing protein [Enterococcus hirae]
MFSVTLFERISYLAKKRDKSLKEIAEELGLSRNAIYQWKTSSPKAETLQKVADYFHVSTDYLLDRTDTPNKISDLNEKNDLEEILEKPTLLFYGGEKLTEEDKEAVEDYIAGYLYNKRRKEALKNKKK